MLRNYWSTCIKDKGRFWPGIRTILCKDLKTSRRIVFLMPLATSPTWFQINYWSFVNTLPTGFCILQSPMPKATKISIHFKHRMKWVKKEVCEFHIPLQRIITARAIFCKPRIPFNDFWSYFVGLIDAWSSLVRVSLKRMARSATYENRKQINVPRVKWDLWKEGQKKWERETIFLLVLHVKNNLRRGWRGWGEGEDCCCWVFVKSFHWLRHA